MLKLGAIIVIMLLIGGGVLHLERGAMARVEAQRLADAAAASAETLERTQESALALRDAQAKSQDRIRETAKETAALERRLSEAEARNPAPEKCVIPVPVSE